MRTEDENITFHTKLMNLVLVGKRKMGDVL